ncbi:MAG: hypothetical protein SOT80_03005 [Candidatus Pseudoruminococcus sp.]|nr:hypothetical protein [Ruminococcus sp.]MDY2782355.1 hypothetical protein [Candidatus Pseudoruminococcus sp.]
MSNLGAYQWITTLSKKVGGPFQLLGITAVGGYAVFRAIEAGGKKAYKVFKKNKEHEKNISNASEYIVKKESKIDENVDFAVGDKFCILEKDGDSILIDKLDDPNSPYFVSKEFLKEISEYNKNDNE